MISSGLVLIDLEKLMNNIDVNELPKVTQPCVWFEGEVWFIGDHKAQERRIPYDFKTRKVDVVWRNGERASGHYSECLNWEVCKEEGCDIVLWRYTLPTQSGPFL